MKMNLEGKSALITGSTKGIGKAIAIELAKEGVNVIITGRKASEVEAVVESLRKDYAQTSPRGFAGDLALTEVREQLFGEIEDVDILVNNMGIFKPMDYFDIDDEVWRRFFEVNVLSGNDLAKHYIKGMLERNFGRVIFIASEEAVMPSGEMPQYSMTKTMNLSLAKSLSKLTRGTQVTVNTVMPGSTLTEGVADMIEQMYKDSDVPREEWEHDFMIHHRPLSQIERLIRPEEIGRLVTFVASPLATAFSGAAIRADGGMVPTIM